MDLKYQIDLLEKRVKALEEENERLITERDVNAATVDALKNVVSQLKAMPDPRTSAERREEEALWRKLNRICEQSPQQNLREVQADAGRAGFVAASIFDWDRFSDAEIQQEADEYAKRVRVGEK